MESLVDKKLTNEKLGLHFQKLARNNCYIKTVKAWKSSLFMAMLKTSKLSKACYLILTQNV